jgi:putative transposase
VPELYNAALEERREAWRMRCISITVSDQSAQLPAIKQERPEYQDIHSQVLQDMLSRLDRAFLAFFRRVKQGERPGDPRLKRGSRYDTFSSNETDVSLGFSAQFAYSPSLTCCFATSIVTPPVPARPANTHAPSI